MFREKGGSPVKYLAFLTVSSININGDMPEVVYGEFNNLNVFLINNDIRIKVCVDEGRNPDKGGGLAGFTGSGSFQDRGASKHSIPSKGFTASTLLETYNIRVGGSPDPMNFIFEIPHSTGRVPRRDP